MGTAFFVQIKTAKFCFAVVGIKSFSGKAFLQRNLSKSMFQGSLDLK